MKRLIPIILTIALLASALIGCGNSNSETAAGNTGSNSSAADISAQAAEADLSQAAEADLSQGAEADLSQGAEADLSQGAEADLFQAGEDMFTNRDYEADYDESDSILIQLNGSSATASSDSVKISGTTITITEDTTHIISGTLDDGMIIVDAGDTAKLQIVLDGASINSEASAALYILNADKVFVTLAAGTENILSNGGAFEAIDENNIDGAIYSKQDLSFNGSGSLTVSSPSGHGIVCKDDLVFAGGTYTVTSASHGLDANDSVRIANASLTIDAGKDGIHAENTDDDSLGFIYILSGTMDIEAEGDCISAGAYMQVENGAIRLLAGGGSENGTNASSGSYGGFMGRGGHRQSPETTIADDNSTSMKGLKAAGGILISNGTITIDSADDAVHSDASIAISGGVLEIASGDDAIHADETLTITAGTIHVTESYEGLEAQSIVVSDGDITVTSSDDGFNASGGKDSSGMTGGRDGKFGGGGMASSNGSIEISGGKISITASGDGLDSNGSIAISGGSIYVTNPTAGDTSVLDADTSAVITGGTFISTGSTTMMAQSFSSSSTQGVIACTTGTQAAGTAITVKDANGKEILAYEAEYTCVLVIISSPDIVKGDTYTLTVGSDSCSITAG